MNNSSPSIYDLSEHKWKLLERISNALFTSFDHDITLQKVAKLIVPSMADYCRIVILNGNNDIKEIVVSHKDPQKVALAEELYEHYKDRPETTHGINHILKSGKPEIISHVDEAVLKTVKDNPQLVKTIQDIGLLSYMGIPLIARHKIIGAIAFSSIKKDRYYTRGDLAFAQEVGKRVALAIDNSRLYKESQAELTERRRTEDKLRSHQDRLELIQTAVNMGTFEYDMRGGHLYWSPELKRLYGFSPDVNIARIQDWEERVYPEDLKRIDKEMREQLKTRDIVEFEFRIYLPDARVRWIYSKAKVFLNKRRKPIRSLGINMDITHRKTMELNLQFLAEASKVLSSSLDYQTTLRNVAMLAVPEIADWCTVEILDEKGELQQVAVAHKDHKKIKWAKELRKHEPVDMTSPTGLPNVIRTGKAELYSLITDDMLVASARTKKQLKLMRMLGLTSAMIIPLFSQGKTVGGISFVTTDKRKQYNKADLAVAEELSSRASLAIDNARLYKGSQEAISIRDDFISVASHELKTPVTSVKIFAQVLQQHSEQIGDNKAIGYFKKMDKQLDKLTELIYNLLNISKIQAGRMEYREKYFPFDTLVKEVIEVLQESAPKHKLVIEGKIGKKIFGDEDRIGQVLSNLVANAIKYSPEADKIIIRLRNRRNQVVVAVQDFGIGMADKHLSRIFERFYRVYDTTDKTFPGLGIGLYISSEIIKRHHGKLWVESQTGQGSTFYFSIPVKRHSYI